MVKQTRAASRAALFLPNFLVRIGEANWPSTKYLRTVLTSESRKRYENIEFLRAVRIASCDRPVGLRLSQVAVCPKLGLLTPACARYAEYRR